MYKASRLLSLLLCSFLVAGLTAKANQLPLQSSATFSGQGLCPQVSPLIPSKHAKLDQILDNLHNQPAFRERAIEALGGAVRIPYVLHSKRRIDHFELTISAAGPSHMTIWVP